VLEIPRRSSLAADESYRKTTKYTFLFSVHRWMFMQRRQIETNDACHSDQYTYTHKEIIKRSVIIYVVYAPPPAVRFAVVLLVGGTKYRTNEIGF